MKNTIINKKDQQNMQKSLRKVSKDALKSGSSRDIAYYINRLFNYSQKFNVDFSTLDYQRHLEKLFSMNDEDKIYDFMVNVAYVLRYEKNLVYTLIDFINKYYNGNISAETLTILINVDDKVRDLIGKDKVERIMLNAKDPYYAHFYVERFKDCNITDFENVVIGSNNAKLIVDFALEVKEANILRLEEALIKTGNVESIYDFACLVERANIPRLRDVIVKTGNTDYINLEYPVYDQFHLDEIFNQYLPSLKDIEKNFLEIIKENFSSQSLDVKELITSGKINQAQKALLEYTFDKARKDSNFSFSHILDNFVWFELFELYNYLLLCSFAIKEKLITREDIADYFIRLSNVEQKNLVESIAQLSEVTQNELLHTDLSDLGHLIDTLTIKNQYLDDHTSVSFSEEEKRWLINFSLIQFNVLPSVVKDFKEVKENITLYLETLKKCDEYKYQYYKEAFEGKITFEQADNYYKYYCEKLLPKYGRNYNFEKILKLKYSKK